VVGGFTFNVAYQQESEELLAAQAERDADPDDDDDGILDEDDDDDDNVSAGGRFDDDEDDDLSGDEVFGVSVGSTFAGADVRLAYANNRTDEESSLGVSGRVPVGPVSVAAYYTLEMAEDEDEDPEDSYGVSVGYDTDQFGVTVAYENEQGDDDTSIDARFSATEDLDIFVGYSRDEEGYAAAEYDLGSGARILASFAETDEAGPRDYKEGTTVALSLDF
jgi:predicted porin